MILEYETYNDDDESVVWFVHYDIDVEYDDYGTGDSPTTYGVEIHKIETESGILYESDISEYHAERITEQAINEYGG